MHGRQTSYTNKTFNSLQFGVFYGFFNERLNFKDFFAQLKCSGRIYGGERVNVSIMKSQILHGISGFYIKKIYWPFMHVLTDV